GKRVPHRSGVECDPFPGSHQTPWPPAPDADNLRAIRLCHDRIRPWRTSVRPRCCHRSRLKPTPDQIRTLRNESVPASASGRRGLEFVAAAPAIPAWSEISERVLCFAAALQSPQLVRRAVPGALAPPAFAFSPFRVT